MVCECASNEGGTPCGSDCLNRLLMIECSSRCPLEDQCQNKRFQRRQYVPTEVFRTDWKGLGIKALTDLGPDMLVMEYCGEVIDTNEFARRSMIYSRDNQQHFYFMALSQDEIIDATLKGNTSRFINHSCDPNCETQKWTVNGRLRVGFFTLRNISKGEEITFDYQFERYGKEAQACFCGSTNCRGYLGKAPDEDDDVTTDDVTADDDITDDVIQAKSEVAESTEVATESSKKKKK
uniref:Histone-lysine N-methyltransferase n=1 Tax=Ciona savignyi TaxID=51511 RepID=H2YKY0_CIOSA